MWQIALAEDERLLPSEKLEQWVANPDSLVRARTAYAIGMVGQESSFGYLRPLLRDNCTDVVVTAAFAAGQVGDTSLQNLLLSQSESENPDMKLAALEALSKLGTDASSSRLSQILNDNDEAPSVRAQTAQWLFRLKDESSQNALIAQAMSTDDVIREKVFYSLMRRSVKVAQPVLILGLKDPIEQIQIFAIDGLSRLNDSNAATMIVPLLLSKKSRVQYHAVNAAAKFALPDAFPYLVDLTGPKTETYTRLAAIQALGKYRRDQSALVLMDLLNDQDVNIACAALTAYATLGRRDAANFAQLFVGDSDTRKRIAAAQAFGAVPGDTARTMLEYLLKDSVPSVRGTALEQLFNLNQPELTNRLIEAALADSDYLPVAIVANQIATTGNLAFVPQLCRLYHATNLTENRQSVLETLTELADSVADKQLLATVVGAALHDSNFGVRKRAHTLAAQISRPIPPEPDHHHSDLTRAQFENIYGARGPLHFAIETSRGMIQIELLPLVAPKTVANFIKLVRAGFYNDRIWHRVVPDFVIQDGCPRGDGWGSPGYEIRCEYNSLPFERGTVGMATSGKDTGGSQYFICQSAQPHLDGRYTVFGQVISGLEIIDQIQLGDSIRTVTQLFDGDK